MNRTFADRYEAGRVLAESLGTFEGHADVVVLGLPRGGVPVAFEVARALGVPFDIFLVRKLGAPGQEELAMGAIASGGVVVINDEVVEGLRNPWDLVEAEIARERMELTRRELLYRGGRRRLRSGAHRDSRRRRSGDRLDHEGGGKSPAAEAAGESHRRRSHGGSSTCREFQTIADACIARSPEPFRAVGLWYENFDQVSDEEVCDLLARQAEGPGADPASELRLLSAENSDPVIPR